LSLKIIYSTVVWERGLLAGRMDPSGKDQPRGLPKLPLRAVTQLSSVSARLCQGLVAPAGSTTQSLLL